MENYVSICAICGRRVFQWIYRVRSRTRRWRPLSGPIVLVRRPTPVDARDRTFGCVSVRTPTVRAVPLRKTKKKPPKPINGRRERNVIVIIITTTTPSLSPFSPNVYAARRNERVSARARAPDGQWEGASSLGGSHDGGLPAGGTGEDWWTRTSPAFGSPAVNRPAAIVARRTVDETRAR